MWWYALTRGTIGSSSECQVWRFLVRRYYEEACSTSLLLIGVVLWGGNSKWMEMFWDRIHTQTAISQVLAFRLAVSEFSILVSIEIATNTVTYVPSFFVRACLHICCLSLFLLVPKISLRAVSDVVPNDVASIKREFNLWKKTIRWFRRGLNTPLPRSLLSTQHRFRVLELILEN